MGVLTTYRGVVEKGVVRLRSQLPAPPDGAEVLVVAVQPVPSLEEQERRLAALSPEEWRKPFDAVQAAWNASEPAPDEGKTFSDDELVALVHEARDEQ
jgi:hypothetical protein